MSIFPSITPDKIKAILVLHMTSLHVFVVTGRPGDCDPVISVNEQYVIEGFEQDNGETTILLSGNVGLRHTEEGGWLYSIDPDGSMVIPYEAIVTSFKG